MPATARLSALDASFLEIESSTAHMHVGWVATFLPPADGTMPTFDDLREHIASRLCRAPRYRQRLAGVPLGLNAPEWVDAESFDIADHVRHSTSRDLRELADMAFSVPLDRQRPLWELWIADELANGRIGVVGKAHHCLVDGIAAVELAGLLLDASPDAAGARAEPWPPRPAPGALPRIAEGLRDRVAGQAGMRTAPARAVRRPKTLLGFADDARCAASALAESLDPAPPAPLLNEPISPAAPRAALAPARGPEAIKRSFGTTLNDAVLAVCAGGVRDFMGRAGPSARAPEDDGPGQRPRATMPPADLGNRISFIFIDLPCDEPDPVERLARINAATSARKAAGNPRGPTRCCAALGFAPRVVQQLAAHAAASSRAYNLTISNIPGPPEAAWMRGCRAGGRPTR